MSYTAYAKKNPTQLFYCYKTQVTADQKWKKKILPIDNLGSIRKKSWQTDWWKLVCSPIKAFYHPHMYQSLIGKEPVKQDDHPITFPAIAVLSSQVRQKHSKVLIFEVFWRLKRWEGVSLSSAGMNWGLTARTRVSPESYGDTLGCH